MTDLTTNPDPLFLSFRTALAGRYSIDRELGRGGMGVVYLAREVQLAAKLSHPNIIPIHSVNETDGFVYFVMAFVDGETLAQRVRSRGPVSASDGARILREVAWALGYAHGQGVIHRDVKPDNILIEAGTGRALVADFGIAAATGDARGDCVNGTPEFMSPEQALGHDVDGRSDLYSLGATGFYALSGRLPFTGDTAAELLARHVTEEAPPLATVGVAVPRKLAQLIDRCLAKDPAHRPASAPELAEQLGVAIEQRRELPAALRAFVKRNGRMDGGGTVLGLFTTVVASVATSKLVGIPAGVLVFAGGVTALTTSFAVVAARRMLDLGFTQRDLVPAFRAEQESSREERSAQPSRVRGFIERVLKRVASIAGSTSLLLLAFATVQDDSASIAIGLLTAAGPLLAIPAALGYVTLLQLRRDVDVELWSAAWTGRFGVWAFSIARAWRGNKPMARAMTHRATELSLGMAAEQLFESLPRTSRESLGDLPGLLQRLQRDAVLLRARFDALQEGLQHVSQQVSQPSRVSDDDEHDESLRVERDLVQQRLRETVGALETIRLSLWL